MGGVESAQGAWPWQVALLLKGKQTCGGSLVSPRWVVSASHCFIGTKIYLILMGAHLYHSDERVCISLLYCWEYLLDTEGVQL